MGQALYRKYRLKTLAEMVGQEHVTEALASAIKSGRISHAYLFTGPRGTGKTSVARILAHEINELPYDDNSPQHLDIIEIDAASNRRIDDIRDLRDKVHIAPTSAKYKVYIIDEVHMLTGESFNALLKTLEEPPAHVVFILATTEVHKLPATIISRTQRYNFRLVDTPKVIAHLRSIADREKISVDESALELIAEHGEGSFRDSISLLDQLANVHNGKIDAPTVERSLGIAPKQAISLLIDALATRDHQAIIKQLGELETQGTTTASLIPQLIRQLQQASTAKPELFTVLDQLLEVPRAYNPRLKLLTTLVGYALQGSPSQPSTNLAQPTTPKHKTATIAAAKPIFHAEKPSSQRRNEPEEPEQATGKKLSVITDEQWSQVLAAIKQQSPPLYGVVRQAIPTYDSDTQTMKLAFRYQLHRRKIEDAKAKKSLVDVMLTILGGAPIIVTEVDASAEAPQVETTIPPVDEVTNSVIAMMGGGEVVNA